MSYVEPAQPRPGSFESQFERDGETWLYRSRVRAPAIRITDAERRALMDAASRQRDRALLIVLGGGIAVVTAPLLFVGGGRLPWPLWLAGGAVVAGIVLADTWRASRSAERAFAGRPPAAPARSRREVSRLRLAQTSWWQIAGQSALVVFWLVLLARERARWPFDKALSALMVLVLLGWASFALRKLWFSLRPGA